MGQSGRTIRVSRPLARSLPTRPVALRLGKRAHPPAGLVRRARTARHHADYPRWRLRADRGDVEQVWLYQPLPQTVRRRAGTLWPLLLPRPRRVRRVLLLSLDRRPGHPQRGHRGPRRQYQLERVQQFWWTLQLHPPRPLPAHADDQRPPRAEALHRPRTRQLRRRGLRPALLRPARADQPHPRRH